MSDWKSKPRERNHRVLISWVDLCRIQGHNNCSVIYLYYTSTFINCSHLKASQSISHFHPSFFSGGGGLLNLINLIKLPNLLIKCKIGSSDSFQLIQIKNIQKEFCSWDLLIQSTTKKVVGLLRIDGNPSE